MKTFFITILAAVAFVGCKKEDMSKYATKEDLENLKDQQNQSINDNKADVYEFSLPFGPSTTWGSSPTIYKNSPDDIVLTFVKWDSVGESPTWAQTPVTIGNMSIISEFTQYSLFINVIKSDGTSGSPLSSDVNFTFKAVVIPVSMISEQPDVNLEDYKEVETAFL